MLISEYRNSVDELKRQNELIKQLFSEHNRSAVAAANGILLGESPRFSFAHAGHLSATSTNHNSVVPTRESNIVPPLPPYSENM